MSYNSVCFPTSLQLSGCNSALEAQHSLPSVIGSTSLKTQKYAHVAKLSALRLCEAPDWIRFHSYVVTLLYAHAVMHLPPLLSTRDTACKQDFITNEKHLLQRGSKCSFDNPISHNREQIPDWKLIKHFTLF